MESASLRPQLEHVHCCMESLGAGERGVPVWQGCLGTPPKKEGMRRILVCTGPTCTSQSFVGCLKLPTRGWTTTKVHV